MKKTYRLDVDCANCANLIETEASRTEGVISASVSFMTQRITLELCDGADEKRVLEMLKRACRRIDPDSTIYC